MSTHHRHMSNLEDQYESLNIADEEEEGLLLDGENDDVSEIDDRWCLVGRFLTNRSIDFNAMQNKMAQLWQPGRGVYVKELEYNLYLFQFYHEVDIERVMEGSPWTFDRVPLIFERLKVGENPRSVVLNKLEFWVQIHNLTTGFISERVVRDLGNYVGMFLKSDPNNFIGVWRDYLRVRVKLDITRPLKRKKLSRGIMLSHFKYEDLPTFCLICGILGHSDRFCERLFDTPRDQIEKPYSLEMKAMPRWKNYAIGARWLRSGAMNKNGGTAFSNNPANNDSCQQGGESSHGGSQSRHNQLGFSITKNQGSSLSQPRKEIFNDGGVDGGAIPQARCIDQSKDY
uniref:DUF4283 domain-containing protein n=1 Tax=Cannabis sativa TaxID=3483 RepID=A0A803NTB2_CANSA